MSRNSSRTRVHKRSNTPQKVVTKDIAPPPHVQQSTSFTVPTEFVKLPTKGRLYKQESSMYGILEVEIKHMTAKEEDIITNQDYINKGIVFDRVISSVLVNKSLKVSDMSDPDKMAILIAARKTGYGSEYDAVGECESCLKRVNFMFNLQEIVDQLDQEEDLWLPDFANYDQNSSTVEVVLPISGITTVMRVMDMEDREFLEQLQQQREKLNLEYVKTIESLRRTVVSVNKDSNPETISQFLDFIPAKDSRVLKAIQTRLQPRINLSQEVECPNCGHVSEREVPLTGGFFWSEF